MFGAFLFNKDEEAWITKPWDEEVFIKNKREIKDRRERATKTISTDTFFKTFSLSVSNNLG